MALGESFDAVAGGLVGGQRGECVEPGWAEHGARAADVAGGIIISQRSRSANVASVAAQSVTGVCVCYDDACIIGLQHAVNVALCECWP